MNPIVWPTSDWPLIFVPVVPVTDAIPGFGYAVKPGIYLPRHTR